MPTLAALFPNRDIAKMPTESVSHTGAIFLSNLKQQSQRYVNNLESSAVIHAADEIRFYPCKNLHFFSSAVAAPAVWRTHASTSFHHYSNDGLLDVCFRLRLVRKLCTTSSGMSFCTELGGGVSPASTLCGLFMPVPPSMLRAVIKHCPD